MSTVLSFPNFQPEPEKHARRKKAVANATPNDSEVILSDVDIAKINCTASQNREKTCDRTIAEYMEAIKAGKDLPPIDLWYDPETGTYYLSDGHHRLEAAKRLKRRSILADVRVGTVRDAMLAAFRANTAHGLRRTREDARRAVVFMLRDPVWTKWTDRSIAKACDVSESTVNDLRKHTGLDTRTEGCAERIAVNERGEQRVVKVVQPKRTPKPAESEARQARMFPAMAATQKTAISPRLAFLKWLGDEGIPYEQDLNTPLGPIPVATHKPKCIYWIESSLTIQTISHAAGRMQILRKFMKPGYTITIVGDPVDPDAHAALKILAELYQICHQPLPK